MEYNIEDLPKEKQETVNKVLNEYGEPNENQPPNIGALDYHEIVDLDFGDAGMLKGVRMYRTHSTPDKIEYDFEVMVFRGNWVTRIKGVDSALVRDRNDLTKTRDKNAID